MTLPEIGTLIAGWLLATLNPGIAGAIARPKRKRQLLSGIGVDAHETRYLLAIVAHRVRSKYGTVDSAAIEKLSPIILGYKGFESDQQLAADYKLLIGRPAAELSAAYAQKSQQQSNTSIWPVPYHLGVLHAYLDEVSLFRIPTQALLLRVDREISLYNEQVAFVRVLHERTFAGLPSENHKINLANLTEATKKLGERAEIAVATINQLIDPSGKLLVAAR